MRNAGVWVSLLSSYFKDRRTCLVGTIGASGWLVGNWLVPLDLGLVGVSLVSNWLKSSWYGIWLVGWLVGAFGWLVL